MDKQHAWLLTAFFALALTPLALAAQEGYGQEVSSADPDLGSSLKDLGRLGQQIKVLKHEPSGQAPTFALDVNGDGQMGQGDLVLSAPGLTVGSRIGDASYAAAATGIDRLAYVDHDASGSYNTDEPLYWAPAGESVGTSFVRVRGGDGPGQVRASDHDFGRPATERGAAYVMLRDDDADGSPDSDEPLYLSIGSASSTVQQGMIRLVAGAARSPGTPVPSTSSGYGTLVHTSDADLGLPVIDLGSLLDVKGFHTAAVDCAGDGRVVLDVDGDGVIGPGDALVGPGLSGLPAGFRLSAAQAGAVVAQGSFGLTLHFVDDDGDHQYDTGEPRYLAPSQGHDFAVSSSGHFVRLAVPGQVPGSVLPGDADEGRAVGSQAARLGFVDHDGNGRPGSDEPLYIRAGHAQMDQVRTHDIRLSPAAAATAATCSAPGAVRALPAFTDVEPAPVVGQQSQIMLRLENPGTEAQDATVHVDVRAAGGTQRLTQSTTVPAGGTKDLNLGWTPAEAGTHIFDITVSSSSGSSLSTGAHDVVVQPATQSLTLLLSSSLISVGNLEVNQTRLLPFEVTAHGATAHQVRLEIIEAHGLTARVASPRVDIAPGTTATLHVEVTGASLGANTSLEQRRIIVRAVADNGISNEETVDLVVHGGVRGIPGIGLPQAGAALAGAGAVAAFFRRRH